MKDQTIFYTHRDGEKEFSWDPVVSTVQGSLADERRKPNAKIAKDMKEFKLVQYLRKQYRVPLSKVFSCSDNPKNENSAKPNNILENRLSSLGARYPQVPGLGIYLTGLSNLQGEKESKKLFDLLFWISSQSPKENWYNYLLLEKIGKIVFNRKAEGKFWERTRIIFILMGDTQLAYQFGAQDVLHNRSKDIELHLKRGKVLADKLFIVFYDNVRKYKSKIRRRGYARSSPGPAKSSKSAIRLANSSLEFLESQNLTEKLEGGETVLKEENTNIEELIFNIFKNSAESYRAYQEQELEKRKIQKNKEDPSTVKEKEENQETQEETQFQSKEVITNVK